MNFKIKTVLSWLDDNIMFILSAFLLAFIPLYPKIPLWSPIEQYIVRVRVEDLVILLSMVIFGIQVLRKKARWYSTMFWGVLFYEIAAILSMLTAFFIIKTVPLYPLHIGKTVLHFCRYIEYFALFFITFGAVKNRQQVKALLGILAGTVIAISIYGYGQKYLFWPVFSTMNREFSKGMILYLTQFARVQSTFGGHYDMGAYLVVVLPLILALALQIKSKWPKRALFTSFWLGTWVLTTSASRMPFVSYVAGVGLVILISALLQKDWISRFKFAAIKGSSISLILLIVFYYFGGDLSERLGYLVSASPKLSFVLNGLNNTRKLILPDSVVSKFPLTPAQLQAMLPKKTTPPDQGVSTDDLAAQLAAAQEEVEATQEVASSKDQPPIALAKPSPKPKETVPPIFKGNSNTPVDVVEEIPEIVEVSTISATTGKTEVVKVKKRRVYSECALKNELSLCIRLETLWPRAIEGFLTSPLVGTGYATLTKESVDIFTEADSTDNNFLRTLGETGLLGFVTFYGCVVIVLVYAVRNMRHTDWLKSAFSVGIFSGSIGLLLNAAYIDVYASSKVAETYWAISGLLIGYLTLQIKRPSIKLVKKSARQLKTNK